MPSTPRQRLVLLATVLASLGLLLLAPASGGSVVRPPLYQVTLLAKDREARTALVRQGVELAAVGDETVTAIVDAAELARLRKLAVPILAVAPLDFPPEDTAYHNYDEMLSDIRDTAAAHPDIVRVTSAGTSLEGRDIVAIKISDEPDVDDPAEPAVLLMALTHSREHLTVEMALAALHHFADSYGRDPALTNLVDQREIYILPNVNPDGGEFDVATGSYAWWRKNRRPNGDGSYGVDLNRNYGYRWGCCGGSSPHPYDDLYRGGAPFSEPETQAVRNFVLAHPNITSAISFHTFAELILYPYSYTYADLPGDMQQDDYRTFQALARQMAETNGYVPQQGSDLYIVSGDVCDWLYGTRRTYCFTFEMYPQSISPGFYPPGNIIDRETRRNFAAVTRLVAAADNPPKVIGLGGDAVPPEIVPEPLPLDPIVAGRTYRLAAEASDDRAVTLVVWQVDGMTIALDRQPPYAVDWTPTRAGPHVVAASAYDAGGNVGTSAPVTVTVAGLAEPVLHLPQPAVLGLDDPLLLTFSQAITATSLALAFEPAVGYQVVGPDGAKFMILHTPFRPATRYRLAVTAGFGPESIVQPSSWDFDTQRHTYLPVVGQPAAEPLTRTAGP